MAIVDTNQKRTIPESVIASTHIKAQNPSTPEEYGQIKNQIEFTMKHTSLHLACNNGKQVSKETSIKAMEFVNAKAMLCR